MIGAHWIRENAVTRVPLRFMFLDTEARKEQRPDGEHQTWRLAVTAFDRCDTSTRTPAPTEWRDHDDHESLWAYIDSKTRVDHRTVLVAHNLAYDLRISQAFAHLPALGWTMHRFSVHDRSVGVTWRRGKRSLVCVDSLAWLPLSLERVGGLVGTTKPDLPGDDGTPDEWLARCRADVTILRAAFLDLVEWVREADLGNWQRTGAGQAWSTWRHRHYTDRVLVHSDEDAHEAETASIYTGRCEAWRHGQLERGPWTEWDLPCAYATIARYVTVPTRLVIHKQRPRWPWVEQSMRRHRFLVRADVTTTQPTLPTRGEHGIFWPIGTLTGWWWDCELANAVAYGAQVTPLECYGYHAAPALSAWAGWVLDQVANRDGELSPVRVAAAKHQSRALIGRFATRYTVWEPDGDAFPDAAPLESQLDLDAKRVGRRLTLGDQAFVGFEQRYSVDACPSIMAVVMAEARVRLWRAMTHARLGNVAYVDTDSLIVNDEGSDLLARLDGPANQWGLRPKAVHRRVEVHGPRQVITSGVPHISGLPRQAEWLGGDRWVGQTWEGIEAALRAGRADRVVVRPATFRLRGIDHRRVHLPGGETAPICLPWHASASKAS